MIGILIFALTATSATNEQPLSSPQTSPWRVGEVESACNAHVALRQGVALGVIAERDQDLVHLSLWDRRWSVIEDDRNYSVQLRFPPSRETRTIGATGRSFDTPNGPARGLILADLNRQVLHDLQHARSMEVRWQRRKTVYTIPPAQAAMSQLIECVARAYRPDAPTAIGLNSYITDDDYPRDALRRGEQGRVDFQVTVGPNGRITDCRVTTSSGSASLDEVSCRIARERLRFTPARDAQGNAISDTNDFSITWRIPNR